MKLGGNGKVSLPVSTKLSTAYRCPQPTAITTLREEPLGGDTEAEDSDSGQHCL